MCNAARFCLPFLSVPRMPGCVCVCVFTIHDRFLESLFECGRVFDFFFGTLSSSDISMVYCRLCDDRRARFTVSAADGDGTFLAALVVSGAAGPDGDGDVLKIFILIPFDVLVDTPSDFASFAGG